MPPTAVRSRGAGNATTKAAGSNTTPQRVLRFVASAHEHQEPIIQQSVVPGANTIPSNPGNIDIPAYGFLGHILLVVTWSGGVAGTLAADAPWNFFTSLWTQDVNGAYFQYPADGYSVLQENIYGGYGYRNDPRQSAIFASASTAGAFALRLPIQVSRHNAYGALANQNAAATYKLGWTVNTSANIWSVAPTTIPTFTIYAFLESWTQPNARDLRGRPQAQLPPLHGSTQQWSYYTKTINAGNNVTQLPRVGNTVRCIVIEARNGSGVRDDTVFPDPFSLNLDGRVLTNETQLVRKHKMSEALSSGATRDAGVWVFYFNNSILGKMGDESSDLWLPTLQSSRLELVGSSATAGTLTILTNDIAQVEVDQSQRYVLESQTGNLEHPELVQG